MTTPAAATPAAASDVQASTYTFIAGWVLLLVLLAFANKSRLGHVMIYYALLLLILFLLVTEYQQIAPLLSGISSVGQLNQ